MFSLVYRTFEVVSEVILIVVTHATWCAAIDDTTVDNKFGLSLCINVAPQSLHEQLTVRVWGGGGGLGPAVAGIRSSESQKKKKKKIVIVVIHLGNAISSSAIMTPSNYVITRLKKCLGNHSGFVQFSFVISAATIPDTASPLKHR
jgi:hypothetical protein